MPPWWAQKLSELGPALVHQAKRRAAWLGSDADELASATIDAVTTYVEENRSSLPGAWWRLGGEPDEEDRKRFSGLVRRVFARRLADELRAGYRHRISQLPLEDVADTPRDVAQAIFLRQALDTLLLEIDALPLDDRDLLHRGALRLLDAVSEPERDLLAPRARDIVASADEQGDRAPEKAMSSTDRTRLQRLREQLKERVARRLGVRVDSMLDE